MTLRTCGIFTALIVVQTALSAQAVTMKLNGGLEATVLNIGRNKDHSQVNVALRIANKSPNIAYLVLVDRPMATDIMDGVYNLQAVSGITFCNNTSVEAASCLGIPEKRNWTVPMQSFTQIDPNPDPNAGIVINFRMLGHGEGEALSFSAHIYVRFVSDPLKDEGLRDDIKYKQFRMMTLSFPPSKVTETR